MTDFKIKEKKDYNLTELADSLYNIAEAAYQTGSPWKKEQYLADLKNAATNYFIIEEKGQIVAFLAYQKIIDEVEIANVAVHPATQNKGYGGFLMKLVDKIPSVNQFFLEVRVRNFSAKNLYLAHGYKVISRRADYYQNPREDALIMLKKVGPIQTNEF
ncbi:ribosomal protein S18-alanine N-acetyltransferase [Enterococcus sp. MJM12]|uniref:Ribosomal protein S18-alanine N-acetyltransferase n=1 Tax=Candidatus Enterococcus myersii TaxID=2815322 RepID=A0ABS3HC55_9ENTE|nr:ribosomal protein S18-alanine N-acetyltransferase [Enterococcus sp. MJM12]MBO0450554.1 ribosomal protein S18-alanine N-acetyltransferase [Enterococcus sp. MJM12]